MDQVDPFQCADRELQAAYKHRHLRAAFCNVQHPKNQAAVTTKARFRGAADEALREGSAPHPQRSHRKLRNRRMRATSAGVSP